MKVMTFTDNSQQIDNADAAIKAIHEKKRKLIEHEALSSIVSRNMGKV